MCKTEHVLSLDKTHCVAIKPGACGANALLADNQCVCAPDYVLDFKETMCIDKQFCENGNGKIENGRCVCVAGFAMSLNKESCTNDCGEGAENPAALLDGQVCKCMPGFSLSLD